MNRDGSKSANETILSSVLGFKPPAARRMNISTEYRKERNLEKDEQEICNSRKSKAMYVEPK